jgi:hypothetical protein
VSERAFELSAGVEQFGGECTVAERPQIGMTDRVGSDLDPKLLERAKLTPCEEARVAVGDPPGDDERRGADAESVEERRRFGEDVSVAVVEGDQDSACGQRPVRVERFEQFAVCDRSEAVGDQPGHLAPEVGRIDRQPAGDLRERVVPARDPVVHEDRDADRLRR